MKSAILCEPHGSGDSLAVVYRSSKSRSVPRFLLNPSRAISIDSSYPNLSYSILWRLVLGGELPS